MLLKNRKKRLCCFTLLELLVSMGVFAILMLALMQFFTSAQSIWTRSNTRYDMYDNARLALNLMEMMTNGRFLWQRSVPIPQAPAPALC